MASRCITCNPGRNKLEGLHQDNKLGESQHEEYPDSLLPAVCIFPCRAYSGCRQSPRYTSTLDAPIAATEMSQAKDLYGATDGKFHEIIQKPKQNLPFFSIGDWIAVNHCMRDDFCNIFRSTSAHVCAER
jgi:hypothetical protein